MASLGLGGNETLRSWNAVGDWTRGEHWLAVSAKQSLSGAITLGGPKETGSLVYKALKDASLKTKAPAAA
jgi:hypothetical protein